MKATSDCDSGSQLLTDVARLLNKLGRRQRRIEKLEAELRKAKDTLAGLTELHWQDEVFLADELGPRGMEDKREYSRGHITRNAAECLGRRLLEEGFIDIREVLWRDSTLMGHWFRVNAKVITTTKTTRIERELNKNEG